MLGFGSARLRDEDNWLSSMAPPVGCRARKMEGEGLKFASSHDMELVW